MITTKTTTQAIHKTVVTYKAPAGSHKDGGRAWYLEAFELINEARQVGELTVQFGIGGCVSSIIFKETESIAQRDIEVESNGYAVPVKRYIS